MADAIAQNVGKVYFLTGGTQRDPYGLSSFHPASNVNRLEVYLEDGVASNVVMINYKADNKGYPTSVFFPLVYIATENHLVAGESAYRTFAKYWCIVPPQVLQWNANGNSPMSIAATVVQTGGDSLIGAYQLLSLLEEAHPATEAIYLAGSVGYCYEAEGEDDYGFYMVTFVVDTYVWTRVTSPVNQINDVDVKQYNIVGMTIQKGNLPRSATSVTISDEYIRYILSYVAQVNEQAETNKVDIAQKRYRYYSVRSTRCRFHRWHYNS